jgi:hypothetical protein
MTVIVSAHELKEGDVVRVVKVQDDSLVLELVSAEPPALGVAVQDNMRLRDKIGG